MSWQDVIVLAIAVFGGLGALTLAFYVYVVVRAFRFAKSEDDLARPTLGAVGKPMMFDELRDELKKRRYRR